GVITQTLLQRSRGKGRCMACEIMVATPAIRALIRDDKVHQIYSALQSGKKHGMQTMVDALYQLYMNREVSKEERLRAAPDANEFLRAIGEKPLEELAIGAMEKASPAGRR
ncbi:MAG TPA: type IV pili twitching motility protein PilT, partial [Gemmatimonadales bacterium]|nr:type IV pili twitching motility protein PilT [Gemmatimonadales bacterium]